MTVTVRRSGWAIAMGIASAGAWAQAGADARREDPPTPPPVQMAPT